MIMTWILSFLRDPGKPEHNMSATFKQRAADTLLTESRCFRVHLDPSDPLCVLPKGLRGDRHLVLGFGRPDTMYACSDLHVGLFGVTGTLQISGVPVWCSVPWRAVFAVQSLDGSKGQIWESDVPRSVRARAQMRVFRGGRKGCAKPTGKLRLVS